VTPQAVVVFRPLSGVCRGWAESAFATYNGATASELAANYAVSLQESRLFLRTYDRALFQAFVQAVATNDPQLRASVEKATRATLGDLVNRTPAELAAMVSLEGSADVANIQMRDACLHLAMLYAVTGDHRHAELSAALLSKFAWAIPQWPIWTPCNVPQDQRQRAQQSSPDTFKSEYSTGLWGLWIYFDLILGTPLAQANAIIADSGATRDINAETAIRSMLDLHVATQRKYNPMPDYSNMDASQIRGELDFGLYMPDPQLVHDGVNHLKQMFRLGFYPDGWWHEGSPAYHYDLVHGMRDICQELLQGYSDPSGFVASDGTRFDNLNLLSLMSLPMSRGEQVIKDTTLPDRTMMGIHDTPWPTIVYGTPSPPTSSFIFGCMGQGSLITGTGAAKAMATLHWSGTGSHAHFDALSLNLWAKETEVISGTQYHPMAGSQSSRSWHESTAAHATVVVDNVNQGSSGPNGTHRRFRQPEDSIAGVPDWRARWYWSQSIDDAGQLRLLSTEFPSVQVIEADAARAYDMVTNMSMYRRTVALVKIDDSDTYVVDIFRVKGGSTHDYMLHSCLQMTQQLDVSLPLSSMSGTVGSSFISDLRGAATGSNWLSVFKLGNGVSLLTFMAGAPGTTVITGTAPAMRRVDSAPFLTVRRTGSSNTFVAVHHVITGPTPRIQGIELVPTDSPDTVALKVHVGDRTDLVISSVDAERLVHVDGGVEVRGAFAHLTTGATGRNWAFLLDGDHLLSSNARIDGQVSHEGVIIGTSSIEDGASGNGFVISPPVPASAALAGAAFIVDMAGQYSWSYRVAAGSSGTSIVTPDEPGFIVSNGLVKQTYFPNWGFSGQARFRIPGYAALVMDGSNSSFVQTGTAVGSEITH